MKHLMIDIEALGGRYIGPIISIGACIFDASGTSASTELAVDWTHHSHCVQPGFCAIDLETVMWWMQQVKRGNYTPLEEGATPRTAFRLLLEFIDEHKPEIVWAKDPDYDCSHLEYWMEEHAIKWPFAPWKQRSVRTIFDLAKKKDPSFKTRPDSGTVHSALADAVFQAEQVIAAYDILGVEL